MTRHRCAALVAMVQLAAGCNGGAEAPPDAPGMRPPAPANDGIYSFASGCYTMDAAAPGSVEARWLAASADGASFAFSATATAGAARFHLRAADLGTYLFYDEARHYLVAEAGVLSRPATLASDVLLVDDTFVSPAEWDLEVNVHDATRFQLRHHQSGRYLTVAGLADA